jgi:hypothetical protein
VLQRIESVAHAAIKATTALIVLCFLLLVLVKLMEWTVRSASWLLGY